MAGDRGHHLGHPVLAGLVQRLPPQNADHHLPTYVDRWSGHRADHSDGQRDGSEGVRGDDNGRRRRRGHPDPPFHHDLSLRRTPRIFTVAKAMASMKITTAAAILTASRARAAAALTAGRVASS